MINLFVPITDSTVGFETFVLFIRYEFITCDTVPLFSHTVFPNLLVLCLSKHARLLNCLLHDSQGIRTAYGHGGIDIVIALLLTPMRHATFIPFGTTFTEILSRKGTCDVNHVVMMCYIIIKLVNSLFGVYLTSKHYIFIN